MDIKHLTINEKPAFYDVINQTSSMVKGEAMTMKSISNNKDNSSLNSVLMIINIDDAKKNRWAINKSLDNKAGVPILLLSTKDNSISESIITKEFAEQISVILNQTQSPAATPEVDEVLSHGLLKLNLDTYQAYWEDEKIELTSTEFLILKGLLRNPERVYSRENIMDFSYGMNVYINDRTIDSHIRYIRKKFQLAGCGAVIKTVHGIGYKMGDCA